MRHEYCTAKRVLSAVLCLAMICTLFPVSVFAAQEIPGEAPAAQEVSAVKQTAAEEAAPTEAVHSAQTAAPAGPAKGDAIEGTDFFVTSVKNYPIAPDITEKVIITNNKEGNSQNIANVMEVNTMGGNAKIVTGYGHLDPTAEGWCMATTTEQAHLYENAYGENVVGGVNASWFNIVTGEPSGAFVMRGKVHKDSTGCAYLAAFSDGSVNVFDAGTTLAAAAQQQSAKQGHEVTLVEAVDGNVLIVKDGQPIDAPGNEGLYPRTAVGIKADGTVVLFQADGIRAPMAVGYTKDEEARMMIELGCVTVLRLDEGGSSTYISQREGEGDFALRNVPAGGGERGISGTVLVVSTAKPSGQFDHANITPNEEIYTPNSVVELTAEGIDASGAVADLIPDTVSWTMAPGSEQMGSVQAGAVEGNHAAATFTSNGTPGIAVIRMTDGGQVVGEAALEIREPDSLSFVSQEVSLVYEQRTDLGLTARYQGAPVHLKDGDIQWSISYADPALAENTAGVFEGNTFVVTSDKKVSVAATVHAAYGSLSADVVVNIGKQPVMIIDGGDADGWDYSNIGTTVHSFDGLAPDAVATYSYGGRGGVVKGSLVSDSDEAYADIVRFGHNAVKLDFDWSNINGTDGACLGLGSPLDIDGTPTAIGVWLYIPEGTYVPWLRAQIQTSTDGGVKYTNAYINFTKGTKDDDLNTGWQYLEADLTQYAGSKIRVNAGMLIRGMITKKVGSNGWYDVDGNSATDQSQLKGSIILDNIQIVYGANNQDITNPTVGAIQLVNPDSTRSDVENGMVLTSDTLNFYTNYHDNEETDEFATGIESAYFYLDGTYYGPGTPDGLGGSTLTNIKLADGEHTLGIYLKDGFGNVTRETRHFTVEAGSGRTGVSVDMVGTPMVGADWALEIGTNQIGDVSALRTAISLTKGFPVKNVVFAEGVTGTYTFDEAKGVVHVNISAVDASVASGSKLATVLVNIPASTRDGASIAVTVSKGLYAAAGTTLETPVEQRPYWMGFASGYKSFTVGAAYRVSAETMVVGWPAVVTVTAADGTPAANVSVYYNDGQLLGRTDEAGHLTTDVLTQSAASYTIYAQDDAGNLSYPVAADSYAATGDETGAPYYIILNTAKDPTTQKNISWMSNPLASAETAQMKLSLAGDMAEAWTAAGVSHLVPYSRSGVVNRVNGVLATDLQPDTTYYYQVGDGKTWSEIRSFRTAPASDRTTEFFIMADIQDEGALTGFRNIVNYVGNRDYDFWIQTGDAVDNVRFYNQWTDALDLFTMDGLKGYDTIHVIGNHEDDDDGKDSYAAKSVFNNTADWYSVEYGNVYVAVLNHVTDSNSLMAFGEWLKADAAASKCAYRVVTGHVPVYTTNPGAKNDAYLNILPGIFEDAGIDFYLAGDAHSYARTAPMTGGQVDENGVVYYICGSTGGKSYAVVDTPEYNFEVCTIDFESVYVDVKATSRYMEITAYNVDKQGKLHVLDTYRKGAAECENDAHTYSYDAATGELICDVCGHAVNAKQELYSGWANQAGGTGKYYLVAGVPQTGYIRLQDAPSYFDENGLAFEGEYTIGGETCLFEDGHFVSSTNEHTVLAGWCGAQVTNIAFILNDENHIELIGSGDMRDFIPQSEVPWRLHMRQLKTVKIDPAITTIGRDSFSHGYDIVSVDFGKNSQLKKIGYRAFHYLDSVTEFNLPETVTDIGWCGLAYTNSATIHIPAGMEHMDDNAFLNAKNIVLEVAEGSYGHEYAIAHNIPFVFYTFAPEVVLSGSCGEDLTYTLDALGKMTISGTGAMTNYAGKTAVPWDAYKKSIREIVIGKDVTTIGNYAFAWCLNVESVTFEEGSKLESVGFDGLHYLHHLKTLTLPETVRSLDAYAVGYAHDLQVIYIPAALRRIHKNAFANHGSSLVMQVAEGSVGHQYAVEHHIKYELRPGEALPEPEPLLEGQCGEAAFFKLSETGVLTISGSGAMTNYASKAAVPWDAYKGMIREIVIGSNITTVGDYAFGWCYDAEKVTFEEGSKLESIGFAGMHYMMHLKNLVLPETVQHLGYCALGYARELQTVYIPAGLRQIHKDAFLNHGSALVLQVAENSVAHQYAVAHGIACEVRPGEALPEPEPVLQGQCGDQVFYKLSDTGVLTISGSGAMTNYASKTAVPWDTYRKSVTEVVIGKDVTTIGDYAFGWCFNLEKVTFEEGSRLESIGFAGLHYLLHLKTLTLPETVRSMGYCAVGYCSTLESVNLPASLEQIHDAAFLNHGNGLTVTVQEGSYAHTYAVEHGMNIRIG